MTRHVIQARFEGSKNYNPCWSNICLLKCEDMAYEVYITTDKIIYASTNDSSNTNDTTIILTGTVRSKVTGEPVGVTSATLEYISPTDKTVKTSTITVNKDTGVINHTTSINTTQYGVWTLKVTATDSTGTYQTGTATTTFKIGITNQTLTLTSNTNTATTGEKITLTTKCVDDDKQEIAGKNIIIYNKNSSGTYTKLTTVQTNKNGIAYYTYTTKEIKTETFLAKSESTGVYTETSSNTITVKVNKHTIQIVNNQTVLYPSSRAKFYILDENGKAVSKGTSVKIKVNITEYDVYTDSAGYVETPVLNLETLVNTFVISVAETTYYQSATADITMNYHEYLTSTDNVLTAINNNLSIPYQKWLNLENINNTGKYATCGKGTGQTEVIASRTGSRNTPAPLKISGFLDFLDLEKYAEENKKWSNEYTVKSFTVSMRIRTRSYSSDTARISIVTPTLTVGNKKKTMTLHTGTKRLPYKEFGIVDCTLSETEFTSNIDTLQNIYITFPKNTSTNTGYIELDNINVTLKYVPKTA